MKNTDYRDVHFNFLSFPLLISLALYFSLNKLKNKLKACAYKWRQACSFAFVSFAGMLEAVGRSLFVSNALSSLWKKTKQNKTGTNRNVKQRNRNDENLFSGYSPPSLSLWVSVSNFSFCSQFPHQLLGLYGANPCSSPVAGLLIKCEWMSMSPSSLIIDFQPCLYLQSRSHLQSLLFQLCVGVTRPKRFHRG